MALSDDQIKLFRHNGFLRLPGRLPDETVAQLKETILKDVENVVEPVARDKNGDVIRLSQVLDRDPIFKEIATSSLVLDSLESLLGPNIELITNRHNHATLNPPSRGYTGLHRDVLQWSRDIVTVIFYLEEATVENGCTHAVPGTHLFNWIQNPGTKTSVESVITDEIRQQEIPLPSPAGGLAVIDSQIFHRVGTNLSTGTRTSMTMGYVSVDELAGVKDPYRIQVRGTVAYGGNVARSMM
jgi:phytanoyl-CoA hydroxylase